MTMTHARVRSPVLRAAALLATTVVVVGCADSSDEEPTAAEQQARSAGKLIEARSPDGHQLREIPAEEAPTIRLAVTDDSASGWNVHVVTERFRFTPENTGGEARGGEGHAHLYVDGKKIARLYGPWYHLSPTAVPEGEHPLTVSLNADDHTAWAVDGKPVQAETQITGSGESGHSHDGAGHDHGDGTPAPEPTATADVTLTVTVEDGEVSPRPRRVEVSRGQTVRLEVRTDREDAIHVHGYDIEQPVRPGEPAVISFTADRTGLFEVETHEPKLQLLQFVVR